MTQNANGAVTNRRDNVQLLSCSLFDRPCPENSTTGKISSSSADLNILSLQWTNCQCSGAKILTQITSKVETDKALEKFLSLDPLATKNQLLNTKCQPEFFVVVSFKNNLTYRGLPNTFSRLSQNSKFNLRAYPNQAKINCIRWARDGVFTTLSSDSEV